NVGNLQPEDTIEISITYAEIFNWRDNSLRFFLPTTIAPRYGDPESVGIQPHQTPEYDLLAENRFELKLTLSGSLADARLDCPSHNIGITHSKRATLVTLVGGEACMDRNFILSIRLPQAGRDTVLVDHDLDGGFVALASFAPRLPAPAEIPPRSVKLVVDCSGSMGGDSIAQARQAISDILGQLRQEDFFNLVAFGSTYKTFFDCQIQADNENITRVRRLLRNLEADMGGTEIHQALQAAVQLPGPAIPQDILLITDGEVWESDKIIRMMKKSGHRVFAVGVGSSVSEAFVRRLAIETGGGCELVVPGEEMTEKIVRHFKRIFLPRSEEVAVRWPVGPINIIPRDIGSVYDGDTLHVFACFDEKPKGQVSLNMTLNDGRTFSQTVDLEEHEQLMSGDEPAGSLARMAMCQSLGDQDEKAATALAVRYQLITRHTNYIVVDVRAEGEKGGELPTLRKVPQMLAAGWAGTGTVVRESALDYDRQLFCLRAPEPQVIFSIAPSPEEEHRRRQQTTPASFINNCNCLHTKWLRPVLQIESFDDLLGCDLPDRILEALETIAEQYDPHAPEEHAVLGFLVSLIQSPVGGEFDRNTRRAIKKAKKTLRPDERLVDLMTEAFAGISKDDWGPQYLLENEDDHEDEADNEQN
ncbi:MAG: VWA domain-containing protein, partial [Desulfobulbaceae bacterium]|nr:VWA domain-containing protein [Desulfobulbaceae bacterium]